MHDYEYMHLDALSATSEMGIDLLYACLALVIVGICALFLARRHKG